MSEDEFEQYRARSYSGGFSPSLRPRATTTGSRPRSAAHRRCRRPDDQGGGSDDADEEGVRQFTADRLAGQHFVKPKAVTAERPASDAQMLKVGFGRGLARPASAAEGCEGVHDDPSWHIGEMRPRGYSAPSTKHSGRCNNGCQLRVPDTQRSPRPIVVSHALRKVRSFTNFRHRLLPCTEVTDQTDDDSKDDPDFRSRDRTGNGSVEALSGGRNEENGDGGPEEWYTVVLTGHRGVGKSSIVASLLRCEQTSPRDSFTSDSSPLGGQCASLWLDGSETMLELIAWQDNETDAEYVRWEYVSAYVVVFSVEDRSSFCAAIDWLYEIRRDTVVDHHPTSSSVTVPHLRPAVILVANKVDLVRNRAVLEQEGRSAAAMYSCKYVEVSAAIDLNIDDLFAGVVRQIRDSRRRRSSQRRRDANHQRRHRQHSQRNKQSGGGSGAVEQLRREEKQSPTSRNSDSSCLMRARNNVLRRLRHGLRRTSHSCIDLCMTW